MKVLNTLLGVLLSISFLSAQLEITSPHPPPQNVDHIKTRLNQEFPLDHNVSEIFRKAASGLKHQLDSTVYEVNDASSMQWAIYNTHMFDYDSIHQLTTLTTNDPAADDQLWEYSYDSSGKLTQEILKKGDSHSGTWTNKEHTMMSYTSSGLLDEEVASNWDSINNQWVPSSRHSYSYSGNARLNEVLSSDWDTAALQWQNSRKTDYTYNPFGDLTENITHTWNLTGGSWDKNQKVEYTYNAVHQRVGRLSFKRNTNLMIWDSLMLAHYTYDPNQNPEEEIYEFYNPALGWLKVGRIVYTYDASRTLQDLIIPPLSHFYPDNREDIVNQPLDYTASMWNDNTAQWEITDRAVYYYSSRQVSLPETTKAALQIFPNPASDYLKFRSEPGSKVNIVLFNATGQAVMKLRLQQGSQIPVAHLPRGTYTYFFESESSSFSGKILLQ